MDQGFYEMLLESIQDGIYCVDTDKRITFWNKGAERITGFLREDVLGKRCADNVLRHVDDHGNELCLKGCPLVATMKDGHNREMEVYLHHRQGHRVPVFVRSALIRDKAGKIAGAVEVFTGNSKNSQILALIEKLQKEAFKDPLTGLGNRRYAEMTLDSLLHGHQRQGTQFGLLFVNADHFKSVIGSHGPKVGDNVLKMIAKSVAAGLRALDVPCRWGGEVFIVFLPNATLGMLLRVGERLRMLVEQSWIVHSGMRIAVTVSLGGALSREGDTAESIVQRADRQLYKSKEAGRNCVHVDSNAG